MGKEVCEPDGEEGLADRLAAVGCDANKCDVDTADASDALEEEEEEEESDDTHVPEDGMAPTAVVVVVVVVVVVGEEEEEEEEADEEAVGGWSCGTKDGPADVLPACTPAPLPSCAV